jgi:hypothetical protein
MSRWQRWTLIGVVVFLGGLVWWTVRPLSDTLPLFTAEGERAVGPAPDSKELSITVECGSVFSSDAVVVTLPEGQQLARQACQLPRSQARQLAVVNAAGLVTAVGAAWLLVRRSRRSGATPSTR